jgi:hypothetical protein
MFGMAANETSDYSRSKVVGHVNMRLICVVVYKLRHRLF